MPSVNVAMGRSLQEGGLREGAVSLLAASLRPVLGRSTILNSVQDVQTAFSSWDNCMQANYCKWPVIAVIVVGGLIVLSVVWCIARCACCAKSCCCECFYCLKCCGSCCGCCDPPKGRPSKHRDEPSSYIPPNQGYRPQEPMSTGAGWKPGAAAAHDPPQYAEFDVSKKGSGGDDALPAMPSWDETPNTKVPVDDVELDQLQKPAATGPLAAGAAASSQSMPLMTGARVGTGPASPVSANYGGPYGGQDAHAASAPYLADPYGNNGQGYNAGYAQQSAVSLDQSGYGAAGMGMAQGRRPPGNPNGRGPHGQNGGYGPGSRQPSQDSYGYGPGQAQGYGGAMGPGPGQRSPARSPNGMPYGNNNPGPRRSPVPQGDYGYGGGYDDRSFGPPRRQYSSDSTRPLAARPSPQRQYSNHTGPAPPSPLQNTGGFDFNSGYSRSQDQGYDDGSYDQQRRPSGPPRQDTGGSYPGYKPYQPSGGGSDQGQQGWSGV